MATRNGFYAGTTASSAGVRSFRVPGTGTVLPVRAEVAPLLIGFATEFNQKVEKLVTGWCWGYAYRAVRNASSLSYHAFGLAIDLNAPRHPLGASGTFTAAQRRTINALCAKYGLRWGGNYSTRKDEMHVEVILNRADALALVRRLQSTPVASTLPKYVTGSRTLREGMVGTDVRDIQNAMNMLGNHLVLDGKFGSTTTVIIKRFQANRNLPQTGVVDANVLGKIREAIH